MNEVHQDTQKKALETFDVKTNIVLKPALENMDNIVKALGLNKTVQNCMRTYDTSYKKELEQIFLAIATSQKNIMQARILNRDGKEIIRVDRMNEHSAPFIVEKSKLQDKSNRDYFQIVSKMKSQNIWHSKLDLNIENGNVEIPYRPTIRIALPLFNEKNFAGMVIINLLTNDLFTSLKTSTMFDIYIIDKENNYILHPNDAFSFNKYKKIQRALYEDFSDNSKSNEVFTYSIKHILNNADNATMILKTKEDYKSNLIQEKIHTMSIVFLLTIFLSFFIAIVIAKKPKELQVALVNAHKKLREFAEIIDKYVITATTKTDTTIVDISSAFASTSGYTKEELIGKQMNTVYSKEQDKALFNDLWNTVSRGKTWNGILLNEKKDGTNFWLEQHIIPKMSANNQIESYMAVGIDISAKVELEKLASYDKLTNIFNRRMIDEFMTVQLESHIRHAQKLSIIMIDIDHFKLVNDTYGHQIGDMVLAESTKIISSSLRKSDIFGRYGGEEFIIICSQTSQEDAFTLAEKLRLNIEKYNFQTVGKKTISLGVASMQENDIPESLIKKADEALYSAKNQGRNRTIIF